jgi:hypothetical protein
MSIFWALSIVPNFVFHLILFVGAIGLLSTTLLTNIPFIQKYILPIKIVSFILLLGGVYFNGAISYKNSIAVEVAELKEKLAKAEAKSEKVNTVVVEKLLTEKQIIREKGNNVIQYVDREVTKYNDQCILPNEVINAHNMAATLKVPVDSEEPNE